MAHHTLVNNDHVSVGRSVDSAAGIVYPGSLPNMRSRVVDKIGQVSTDLPRWMVSIQPDGNILGFTHAWVIAYTLPGQSSQVAYTINQNWEIPAVDGTYKRRLHRVDYTMDRYILGSQFTKNWDPVDQRWFPSTSTTVDLLLYDALTADSTDITVDKIIDTPTRFLTVDIAENNVDSATIDSTTITVDATLAAFKPLTVDLTSVIDPDTTGTETLFDGGSCRFIEIQNKSADFINETADTTEFTADGGLLDANTTFKVTDEFDEYLLFPGIDIINKKKVATDDIIQG